MNSETKQLHQDLADIWWMRLFAEKGMNPRATEVLSRVADRLEQLLKEKENYDKRFCDD